MCPPASAADNVAAQPAVAAHHSKRATAPAAVTPGAECFAGVIKSYNDRRGFGFLACEETARRFGRDVYLSKIESQAAIAEGEHPLKEGDHCQFAVVLSTEGFPQAAGVQRLQRVQGVVLRFSGCQGGAIACDACHLFGVSEVALDPQDCGCLLLCPGDEVSFCLESGANGPQARLVRLVNTARPASAMLGCFTLHFPREEQNQQSQQSPQTSEALPPIKLACHAFSNRICLEGLPADLHEADLMLFFKKYAATQATAVHSAGRGFASVQFPDVSDVARLLVGGAHAFNSQDKTLLAILEPNCSNTHDGTTTAPKTLPAMPAPALLPGEAGVIQVCWSALNLAAAYRVELRAAGAGGWSAVDSYGRVQPEGAAPQLSAQTTCLAIHGLSLDMLYEA